jgi:TRAP-type uncharacterized transport system substrate-binding protein
MVGRRIALMWDVMASRWIALASTLIALLVTAVAVWLYSPPRVIVVAAGPTTGAYYKFGKQYAEALRRDKVAVVVLPTRGAVDNLRLLHDDQKPAVIGELINACVIGENEIRELSAAGLIGEKDAKRLIESLPLLDHGVCSRKNNQNQRDLPPLRLRVDAALIQGGVISTPEEVRGLATLGTVFYEPLWLFKKPGVAVDDLEGLKDKKTAIGTDGSGTHKLASELLAQLGINGQASGLLPLPPNESRDQLKDGKIDAMLIVAFWDAPIVQEMFDLLRAGQVRLGSYPQADAYADHNAYLHKVVLHRGAIDPAEHLPAEDVSLIAAKASLIVRDDLHSATQYLLLNAARPIHEQQRPLQRAGEFPAAEPVNIPLGRQQAGTSPAAEAVKVPLSTAAQHSSLPYILNNILSDYLPAWIAGPIYTLIPFVFLLGALSFLSPVVRTLPFLFNWLIQRQVFSLLLDVLTLEAEAAPPRSREHAETLALRLEGLEMRANTLLRRHLPASLAALPLILRQHIDGLRTQLQHYMDGPGEHQAQGPG